MIHSIVFSDEITIWWKKEKSGKAIFSIFIDDEKVGETEKTHFSIKNLLPQTLYFVRVEKNGVCIGEEKLVTNKQKRKIDVTLPPYLAIGDGVTLNTVAIQKALDDCTENDSVYLPKGVYVTGALKIHGNTELFLSEGAVLQGSDKPNDYLPKIKSRFEGYEIESYSPLIGIGTLDHTAGATTRNVVIRGGGRVTGGGKALCESVIETERERLKEYLSENADYIKTCENDRTIPGRARPRLVSIDNCENVVLTNVTLEYGASWNIQIVYSKDVTTYGCKINSLGVWNGDGWDPDSSENCVIFNTEFHTHDDAIAIKSGKNAEGDRINRPTKGVCIFDCWGMRGIAIGSELSGGIEDVAVWDCQMNAFRVKTTRKRGGYVKNVRVYDCVFNADIRITTKYLWNDDGEPSGKLTELKDFRFENVEIFGFDNERQGDFPVSPIQLIGFEEKSHYVKNVAFYNIKLHKHIAGESQNILIENVENVTIEKIEYIAN